MDELGKLAAALRSLGDAMETGTPKNANLHSHAGWNFPPLNGKDIGDHARTVAGQIDEIDRTTIRSDYSTEEIVQKVEAFKSASIPNYAAGNYGPGYTAYVQLVDWIRTDFAPYFEAKVDWQKIADANKLPRQFAARLRSLDAVLEKHKTRSDDFAEQIRVIDEAYETAQNLPTDAASMQETRDEIARLKREAEGDRAQAALNSEKVADLLESVRRIEGEAEKLLENTESAYRAATTKGLGEAFHTRAEELTKSMMLWVYMLLGALVVGAFIGGYRVWTLQALLQEGTSAQVLWLNMILSGIALAAPIWFAWIATKQIGHRFRLSEDYAYKASVAKAYEGYRREAARLDDDFVKRLFASILDRLGEAPIRFVEHETPGTPWHEIFGRRRAPETGPAVPLTPTRFAVPTPPSDAS